MGRLRRLARGGMALGLAVLVGCGFWRKPPEGRPALVNPELSTRLGTLLRYDVPLITADSLARAGGVLTLDVREPGEFAVSHLAGARRIDPGGALPPWVDALPRDTRVAVYCSVGYRSEAAGRRLRAAGFTEVSNLYGSIFEWVDRGYPVVDSTGATTPRLHVFNPRWGQLVTSPRIEKVYEP